MTCTKRGKEKDHTMAMDIDMALLLDQPTVAVSGIH